MPERTSETCYMCEKPATSGEHAPPQCLFPEQCDLPPGIDLRRNLITVPSCDEHNSHKQKDDEYLRFCLLMNIANNDVAFTLFSTKITRAAQRNPAMFHRFTETHVPIVAVDKETGIPEHTYLVKIDGARFRKSLDHIARALFYHRYKAKFMGTIGILYDSGLYYGVEDAPRLNEFHQQALAAMKRYFDRQEHAGENPEVFRFILEDVEKRHVLRMQFYGGTNVYAAFIP